MQIYVSERFCAKLTISDLLSHFFTLCTYSYKSRVNKHDRISTVEKDNTRELILLTSSLVMISPDKIKL